MTTRCDPQFPGQEPTQFRAGTWRARLQLGFELSNGNTVLRHVSHAGPLRVQRPFYPEGNGCCHVYLLHPPGGIVAGDELSIGIHVGAGSHALLTTPAAGKIYHSDDFQTLQRQTVRAELGAGALLEWLPQETIVFDGCQAELVSRFDLAEDAVLFGWDFICLGRRWSEELFNRGRVRQIIELWRDDKPLYIERACFDGGSASLVEPWGMQGFSVVGTAFCTLTLSADELDGLRSSLPVVGLKDIARNEMQGVALDNEKIVLSQVGEVLIARYLGHSAERGRKAFEHVWQHVRPRLAGREVVRPRIWNT